MSLFSRQPPGRLDSAQRMKPTDDSNEPDWDIQLELKITPAGLIHALFGTANSVHTAWSSCVDRSLVLSDLSTLDEGTGNYCRLAEQEFVEDGDDEDLWHDWTVEVRLGEVIVTGHWQIPANASPMEWEWCAREAEGAFDKACALLGRRIRRGIGVEEPDPQAVVPKPRRH